MSLCLYDVGKKTKKQQNKNKKKKKTISLWLQKVKNEIMWDLQV